MKKVARILLLSTIILIAAIVTITACGGNAPAGSGGGVRAFIFNSNPLGFHITKGFGPARASIASPFVVNAQATTAGGGNFPGFCDSFGGVIARGVTVVYGIGRWSTGNCNDRTTPTSDVGVSVPQAGQIGNITVDARGLGTSPDDGAVGLNSVASGQVEVRILHADGTHSSTSLTCSLGVSATTDSIDHCEDKNAAHHVSVVPGDQVIALFWIQPGDSYRAVRVNIEFATPTF